MDIKKLLKSMCVIDKATCLNLLIRQKFSGTPLEALSIQKMFENYNKENNMLIDSYMWKLYSLHYKDYIDTSPVIGAMCMIDVIKLEQSIDKSILHYIKSK